MELQQLNLLHRRKKISLDLMFMNQRFTSNPLKILSIKVNSGGLSPIVKVLSFGRSGSARLLLPLRREEFESDELPGRFRPLINSLSKFVKSSGLNYHDWWPGSCPWDSASHGTVLYYEWDSYNRSAFQKLIEEHFGVGVKNLRLGNRVLLDALVDGESIQGVDGHIDGVNGVLFRVTRLGGRRLNAFLLRFSEGIHLNYARSTRDGILVQDMTKPDESTKLYKISTYDANSDLSKAMFDFSIQEAPSGWVQVWCYEDSDPSISGSTITWGAGVV